VTRVTFRVEHTLCELTALGGENCRAGDEPLRLLDRLQAARDPLVERPGDGLTTEDVPSQLIDEIESAGGAEVVAAPQNVNTQVGERVVANAGLARRHGMIEAMQGQDATFYLR